MVIKMGTPSEFMRTWFDIEMYKGEYSLGDGIYFSENKPISNDYLESESEVEYEFDTEKDSICCPYDTDMLFLWKNEKPVKITEFAGQSNYGSAISFHADKIGYYTICMEND